MTRTGSALRLAFASIALCSLVTAQTPAPSLDPAVKLQPGETAVAGQCLTKEELDLNLRLRTLKRPTRGYEYGADGDDQSRFDPHYLVGKWTIEGTLPDSPLAPAGELTGTESVRHVDGCTFESLLDARVGGLSFTAKTLMVYDRRASYLVRLEEDSRGFQLVKVGPVGGDSGGYFSHHWEAPAVTHNRARLRLKGTTLFSSPENYRLRMQVSTDGGPFVSYGTVWWRRAGSK
jgi:hypothetical protein